MSLFITGCILLGLIIVYFELQLPNVAVLNDFKLQTPLRIYSSDGKLIAEFGQQRRNPVRLNEVPPLLIDAILATEDQRYYEHAGVDPIGLMRAAIELAETGTKSQGGSTITMQVARNFFLTRKKTFNRKFKEILLAIKIDSEFSKQKILELYLNRIYLGNRAYGVAAAAQVYYGKPLQQLTLPQLAMLAGLPKAPSALNPIANPKAAKNRRNHVLERMYQHGYITKGEYTAAIKASITASYHGEPIKVHARYVAEMVRDAMFEHYGEQAYTAGFNVYTTINSYEQQAANDAVHKALIAYDQRHGYRGPEANWGSPKNPATLQQWINKLKQISTINGLIPAVILQVNQQSAIALLGTGETITLAWPDLNWAFKYNNNKAWGPKPKVANDVVRIGDLIRVQHMPTGDYKLSQIPAVQGALVALNPKDGAILALVGGFNYFSSNYNRVTQAQRQPGSNFKPFIYAAALAKGYTLATIINDAPIVINDPSEEMLWRPQNDTHQFYGPTRLRVGLMQSRNLVSIRLLQDIDPKYAVKFAARFGFDPDTLSPTLSLALGSAVVTPLELVNAYAVFANGGYKVDPYLISHITDTQGTTIYQAVPKIACTGCVNLNDKADHYPIYPKAEAPRVLSPTITYLLTSALKSVIQGGTGRAAKVLNRGDLAGKTGTTNQQMDAWFSGFNSDIVATCWVGFDKPQSLYEYGNQAALPMWIDFMRVVLQGKAERSMAAPPGIITVKIDPQTGLLATAGEKDAIFEIFRKNHVPKQTASSDENEGGNEITEEAAAPLF